MKLEFSKPTSRKRENSFQGDLVKELEDIYPDSYVYPNDGGSIQGFPDITILHHSGKWATLECKKSKNEPYQPNQKYYVDDMSKKAFSAVIFPENKKEILDGLHKSLEPCRKTRVPKSK